jgi:lysozyme
MKLALRLSWSPLVAVLALGCSSASESERTDTTGDDSEALRTCARGPTVKGVDVAYYEGAVDWQAVKGSGRAFAFSRVSDGLHHVDPKFNANWSETQKAGLIRGAYQFFRPSQDPIAQADLVISKVGTLGADDLPPVLDVETTDGVGTQTIRSHMHTWLTHVEDATGRRPIIYTAAFMSSTIGSGFSQYPLWVANYGATCPSMPSGWSAWQFWQTSETGRVSGIDVATDLDVFNGTLADLRAFAEGSRVR